jgi:Zn-dependent alcohol dehydrogenase
VTDELEVRDPGPGEVQVRVLASGICHSDLNVLDGTSPVPPPVVLGHEAAGLVERLGHPIDEVGVAHFAPGDPVCIGSMTPCGECRACRSGRFGECPEAFGRGATPFHWRGRPVRSYANDAAGRAVDAAIECSGATAAIEAAIAVTAPRGTTALVGLPRRGTRVDFDVDELMRNRRIVGSLNGAIDPIRDLPEIVRLARAGDLDLDGQVSRVWPLGRVGEAIGAVRAGEVVRAVLDHTA